MVARLRAILREAGALVAPKEVEVPAWRTPEGRAARLEVSYLLDGARHYADVTVRHPRAVRYRRRASREDGYAAR